MGILAPEIFGWETKSQRWQPEKMTYYPLKLLEEKYRGRDGKVRRVGVLPH